MLFLDCFVVVIAAAAAAAAAAFSFSFTRTFFTQTKHFVPTYKLYIWIFLPIRKTGPRILLLLKIRPRLILPPKKLDLGFFLV